MVQDAGRPVRRHERSRASADEPRRRGDGSAPERGRAGDDRVTITNESQTDIAFFVRAAITAGRDGGEVLPIRYSTNDVSLFPGESTTVTARYLHTDLGGAAPGLILRGFNVPEQTFSIG